MLRTCQLKITYQPISSNTNLFLTVSYIIFKKNYFRYLIRQSAVDYSKQAKFLYLALTEAILESLGLVEATTKNNEYDSLKEFQDGSQLIVVNCYPSCPEPDLTLGMPPHSDYGFLTLLLQDEVKGLQIQHDGRWVTVETIPNSFVVNVGDHLEVSST